MHFQLGKKHTLETQDDGAFDHDEADVTMISYVLQAANHCKSVFRVLGDDTDVFVIRCIRLVCSSRCR